MTDVLIGIAGVVPADPAGLDFVELRKLPTVSDARRMRRKAPADLAFSVRGHPAITHPPRRPRGRKPIDTGHFLDTPAVHRAWKATLEIARVLECPWVIFDTPASFRPIDEHIGQFARFMQWAHRDRLHFGWNPRGHEWTDERLWEVCRELSLTHVVDPRERVTARGRPPYFRLSGHAPLDRDTMIALLDSCTAAVERWQPPVFCLFATDRARADAAAWREFLDQP